MAYASPKNTALNTNGTSAAGLTLENRSEERLPADGNVCLILDRDGSEAVNGRLADVSPSGFRAVHTSQQLNPGRVLRFHFDDRETGLRRSGWARIIWNRVQGSTVESGCFIVIAD